MGCAIGYARQKQYRKRHLDRSFYIFLSMESAFLKGVKKFKKYW
jgi:hypothetical protein